MALTTHMVALLGAVTEVSSVSVHSDDGLATAAISTTGYDVELTDNFTGLTRDLVTSLTVVTDEVTADFTATILDTVTVRGVINELSAELVDGDDDLATDILSTTGSDAGRTAEFTVLRLSLIHI